jgi:hypothetical protein
MNSRIKNFHQEIIEDEIYNHGLVIFSRIIATQIIQRRFVVTTQNEKDLHFHRRGKNENC